MDKQQIIQSLEYQLAMAEKDMDRAKAQSVTVGQLVEAHKHLLNDNPNHPLLQYMTIERFFVDGEEYTKPTIEVPPQYDGMNGFDFFKKYTLDMALALSEDYVDKEG